jgi:redox-sensitive bicupin YhaK (pirin superfamily)
VPEADVRRSAERFVSRAPGRESRYSFSYAEHYDAATTHFGVLLAHNDETLDPGAGYDDHPHSQLEIVTWVLAGTLTHRDSTGADHAVPAGWVQVVSAGTGIRHSETNQHDEPVRYLQMWVAPDGRGGGPTYQAHPLQTVGVASLHPPGQPGAQFSVVRPDQAGVTLPAAAYRHLFVAAGHVDVEGVGALDAGDAVRFTEANQDRVRGEPGSLIGIWAMRAALGG